LRGGTALDVGRSLELLCLLIRVLEPLGDPWMPTITSDCCEGAELWEIQFLPSKKVWWGWGR